MDSIQNLIFHALYLVLLLSLPPILTSMILGLIVAIFQAATQINEQTLSSTVKLISVVGILILLGPWLSSNVIQFAQTILNYISKL